MGSSNSTTKPRNQNREKAYPNPPKKYNTMPIDNYNQTLKDTRLQIQKTADMNKKTAEMNKETAQTINRLKEQTNPDAQKLREHLQMLNAEQPQPQPENNIEGGFRPSFNQNRYRNPAVSVIGMY